MVAVRDRSWWGATAAQGPPMRLPVSEAWLHHTVSPLTDDPAKDMRTVERIGVQRFGRFSYSWAYHRRSRLLLEGAGDTIGAHTADRNSTSLGVVLIGNYDDLPLDDTAVADLADAFDWLVGTGRLTPGMYPTGGHRDLKSTACPGVNAYARLNDIRRPVEDDDMTPEQQRWLDERLDTIQRKVETTYNQVNVKAGALANLIRALGNVDVDALAGRIAEAMPASAGEVSVATVKQGLTEWFMEASAAGDG